MIAINEIVVVLLQLENVLVEHHQITLLLLPEEDLQIILLRTVIVNLLQGSTEEGMIVVNKNEILPLLLPWKRRLKNL